MSPVVDVVWVPREPTPAATVRAATVIVDVIRATTSITTALARGAARVVPTDSVEAARRLAAREGALLCGERRGVAPAGFDLGNSPLDYEDPSIAGRTLVYTTTNGTRAMRARTRASPLLLGCFRNLEALARHLGSGVSDGPGAGLVIVCAGRRGRVSMDDAWCAGHLVERLMESSRSGELTDGARAARELARGLGPPTPDALGGTAAGGALRRIGLGRDLERCAAVDDLTVVPVWRDGAFVRGGEEEP